MDINHRHIIKRAPLLLVSPTGILTRLAFFVWMFAAPLMAANLDLTNDPATGRPGKFAEEEIRREAAAKGMVLSKDANAIRIAITLEKDDKASAQRYSIRVKIENGRRVITVRGADETGAMYGGLDIAEAISTGTLDSLKDTDHKPHIAQRGIKFNIPFDLRTPSYTDCSDAAQANIPEMWERGFWTTFLDSMARHRYNVLSLWSLHPFPSLVKVPEFPEVALDDVWRTRAKLDDTFSMAGNDMVRPAMLADHEVIKRMTINEKIDFWRWVMQQAADRGIRVYFFTWNVFTWGAEGKHGITNDLTNEITKKYFRVSVREMPPDDKMAGFYMGPDGYVCGRDFLERHPDSGPRPLVMDKQWYSFMLWGRLSYDPSLPDSHFERILAARHPTASSQHLFRALQGASQVMPLITRFFWGDIDVKWYPEACLSHPKSKNDGFDTVSKFMEGSSMPGAEVLCIRDWRARLNSRQPMAQTTPLEIADALDGSASETFASLDVLREAAKKDSELQKNVNDCEALAWLGRYYASKIRGACALALYDLNVDKFEHDAALRHLGEALTHWKQYAAVRDAHYVPALYNRVGYVDVTALTEQVAADLDIARNWKPGTLKDDGKRSGAEKGFRK